MESTDIDIVILVAIILPQGNYNTSLQIIAM